MLGYTSVPLAAAMKTGGRGRLNLGALYTYLRNSAGMNQSRPVSQLYGSHLFPQRPHSGKLSDIATDVRPFPTKAYMTSLFGV